MDYENIISEIIDLINHLITFKNSNERTKYYEINKQKIDTHGTYIRF